ncbi:MAG: four helix bundle protein [Deltaproteobacteria bacterium]|nr:four helix bundle protein [Deltaproteobacteria bacterium]
MWKVCRELRISLTNLIKCLPGAEKYRLADQIIRAARSVTNNIAEGYGRFHFQENMQFCRQSRGSLYELMDHLQICLDEGYIKSDTYGQYRDECLRCIQLINGYIRFISKQKGISDGK